MRKIFIFWKNVVEFNGSTSFFEKFELYWTHVRASIGHLRLWNPYFLDLLVLFCSSCFQIFSLWLRVKSSQVKSNHFYNYHIGYQAAELYERLLHACDRHLGKTDPRTILIAFETVKLQIKTGKILKNSFKIKYLIVIFFYAL